MRFIKSCGVIVGLGIFIIGLAGIPEDWATWKDWVKPVVELINHDIARWVFAITGLCIIASILLWPSLQEWLFGNKNQLNEEPSFTTKLSYAIEYIDKEASLKLPPSREAQSRLNEIKNAVLEQAIAGELTIWGSQIGHHLSGFLEERNPRKPIPAKYWGTHELTMYAFDESNQFEPETEKSYGHQVKGTDVEYTYLWVNEHQIKKSFPPKISRIFKKSCLSVNTQLLLVLILRF